MGRVLIQKATYENIKPAIDRVFEVFPLGFEGKKVFIKPNVLRASSPEEGIVTNPAVLKGVVEKVETVKPSSIVVGDNPGVMCYGENEFTFKKTGLFDAAKGYYRNIGETSVAVSFNREFLDEVTVSKVAFDADIMISLPKFKTHGLTVLTGAVKNSYGLLPGGIKARLHKAAGNPERFHRLIVDVFMLRIPELFIVDAIVGMEGNGPVSTELRDIGLILASDNAVALDAVISYMMGAEPYAIPFIRYAHERGLGEIDLSKIDIIGDLVPIPNFKLPPISGEFHLKNKTMEEFIDRRTKQRPKVDEELCTGCGVCIEQCPVSAISIKGDFPQADTEKCIVCFCCQEACPSKAMKLG
ncbi:MAG: DUF362 domain-containing protein [Syntrophorhabdaceae bacterium]|nr:DUF362 domain-containing protein [Syntrophorhabdaceae bacterium]